VLHDEINTLRYSFSCILLCELELLDDPISNAQYREKATIVMMNQSRFFQAGSIMSGITVTFGNQRSY
jgi:hypothetical protein